MLVLVGAMAMANFFERARKLRASAAVPQERGSVRESVVGRHGSVTVGRNGHDTDTAQAQAAPASAGPAGVSVSQGHPLQRLRRLAQQETVAQPSEPSESARPQDVGEDEATTGVVEASAQVRVLEGRLRTVRVFNEWGVGTLRDGGGELWRLSGTMLASLKEGLSYRIQAVERRHPVHGVSFEVVAAEPTLDDHERAIARYLVSHFDGVGRAKARRYIAALKDADPGGQMLQRLRDVLLHEPWRLDIEAVLAGRPSIEVERVDELPSEGGATAGHDTQAAASLSEGEANTGDDESAQRQRIAQVRQQALADVLKRHFLLRLGHSGVFKESAAKGLAKYFAQRVLQHADALHAAWSLLVEDPYAPIGSAPGYGFATAEWAAKSVGLSPHAPERMRALGAWVAEQACARSGHTWLAPADFVAAVRRADPTLSPQEVLTQAAKAKRLVVLAEERRIYLPHLYRAEMSLAHAIAQRIHDFEPLTSRTHDEVVEYLRRNAHRINPIFADSGLDDAQLHAVASIMTAPTGIHVLRGGPGTGKTTIVECLAWLLRKRKNFLYAAPTGKAARVLSARVRSLGASASTICSLLRGTDEAGYEVCANNPLACDVLVIDETTMVGLQTAAAIMDALPPHAHVIFLGDPGRAASARHAARAGQLPSIAPGRFMHDLEVIPGVQALDLRRVYRNSGGILDVVEEVAAGRLQVRDRESVSFAPLPPAQHALQTVLARYLELARRDGLANTVLIMPRRVGDPNVPGWNVTWANAVLRDVLNRDGLKLPGTVFRLGDRIIVRQNMSVKQPESDETMGDGPRLDVAQVRRAAGLGERYEEAADLADDGAVRVVNGDTGFIVGWRTNPDDERVGLPRWVQLLLDDGRTLWLPGEDIGVLDHAYALTVHAVQGSEYRNVLVCVTDGTAQFMNANMLLTAFSRARQRLEVWGDEAVLRRVAATPLPVRNSALPQRVQSSVYCDVDSAALRHPLREDIEDHDVEAVC